MAPPSRYRVPAHTARAEEVIDRSRFICILAPASTPEEAHALVRDVRAGSPDATHHCWAFVAGPPGSTSQIGMSDDGEPHGTAGRPILTVLLHSGVGEVAAVVTRYYGGTKLGTGGLVRAYSQAVQSALAELVTREKVEYAALRVTVGYAQYSAVQHLLPAHEAEVTGAEFAAAVQLDLRVPSSTVDAFRAAVGDATGGTATITDASTEPS